MRGEPRTQECRSYDRATTEAPMRAETCLCVGWKVRPRHDVGHDPTCGARCFWYVLNSDRWHHRPSYVRTLAQIHEPKNSVNYCQPGSLFGKREIILRGNTIKISLRPTSFFHIKDTAGPASDRSRVVVALSHLLQDAVCPPTPPVPLRSRGWAARSPCNRCYAL